MMVKDEGVCKRATPNYSYHKETLEEPHRLITCQVSVAHPRQRSDQPCCEEAFSALDWSDGSLAFGCENSHVIVKWCALTLIDLLSLKTEICR